MWRRKDADIYGGIWCRQSFCLFKQKTAYGIRLGLVGSEMCIGDRSRCLAASAKQNPMRRTLCRFPTPSTPLLPEVRRVSFEQQRRGRSGEAAPGASHGLSPIPIRRLRPTTLGRSWRSSVH